MKGSREGKIRVGLLFGGRSSEHEISIRSAHYVASVFDRRRFEIVPIGIDRDGRWHLHSQESFRRTELDAAGENAPTIVPAPAAGACRLIAENASHRPIVDLDVVFPVLHGPYGEDGTMQGLLELLDVPYVGAGVTGSAIGMDKDVQKRLLAEAGLPIVPFRVVSEHAWLRERAGVQARCMDLGLPLFVKPANMGSSVGIGKALSVEDLDAAIECAFRYDAKVVIEKGMDAREIECAILGNDEPRASVLGEIVPEAEFYSYEAKYAPGSTARLLIPAPLPAALGRSVQDLAVQAFRVLECAGMARVDFFVERGSDRVYVNELNTIPGFTSISMYPKLWEASGLNGEELTAELIRLAFERRESRARRIPKPA
jgi:D-alanine-D-alanine ligase